MKCPKCGINYDDSDRECPMCGAPKPLFAKDKSKLAKTTARPATDNKKTDSMGSILDLGSNKKSSWSKPKKSGKNKIGVIVIIAVIIINFIPALISLLSNAVSDIPRQIENLTVHQEPEPDMALDVTKMYTINDDEIEFSIFSDGTYYVSIDDFEEWGQVINHEYYADEVPELETFLLDYGINLEDFNINIAILTAEDSDQDKYIIVAQSKSDEQTFFYDLNSDIDWLDDGVLVEGYRFV